MRIVEKDEQPWFVLKDVCEVLEIKHVASVKERLTEDVVSNHPLQTAGGIQHTTIINEDGLYDVILESRKPEAKAFRKWVTGEVLPTIRKHGAYITPEKLEEVLLNPDTLIRLATDLKTERESRIAAQQKIEADGPTNAAKISRINFDIPLT